MTDAPRDVRLFVAAYETRSFTAAAARENATQSGVSQHVRRLEERFGARLFARAGGGVAPTPAGDAFYRRCIDILQAHASAAAELHGFRRGLQGEVAVGLMPTMTRCVLAPALARFLDLHPNVTVRVTEAYSAALTELVRAGELAFAVVPDFAELVGLRSVRFITTPELLVTAASSGRGHGSQARLSEFGPLKIVVPERQNTRRQTLEAYLAGNGVRIARLLELDSMMGTLDLVANSDWVTILPGVMMARDRIQQRFTIHRLASPALSLDLVAIEALRHPLAAPARAFLDVLSATTIETDLAWSGAWSETRVGADG